MTTRDRILFTLLLFKGQSTYSKVFSFLPPAYDRPNFYGILRRMEADQLIKRTPSLRLGPDALKFLEGRFGPRIRSLLSSNPPNPSQQFSLVVFDFPLAMAYHRARLQTKLEQLGMGMLRKGVYISPYDVLPTVAAWAEENQVLDRVNLFKANSNRPNTYSHQLSALSHSYLSLLDRLPIARAQQVPQKRTAGLKRMKTDFLDLLAQDPLLPDQFLPADWPFTRVAEALMSVD